MSSDGQGNGTVTGRILVALVLCAVPIAILVLLLRRPKRIEGFSRIPDGFPARDAGRIEALVRDVDRLVAWCVANRYPDAATATTLSTRWSGANMRSLRFGTRDGAAYLQGKRTLNLCTDGDDNTMRFVVVHELAHLASRTYGHNDEFRRNFVHLLRAAVHLGAYVPVNYTLRPTEYCGVEVSRSPCDAGPRACALPEAFLHRRVR